MSPEAGGVPAPGENERVRELIQQIPLLKGRGESERAGERERRQGTRETILIALRDHVRRRRIQRAIDAAGTLELDLDARALRATDDRRRSD